MDKQKLIEEMADILCESKNHNCNGEDCKCIKQATDLYEQGYRKIDENSVVLTEQEFDEFREDSAKVKFLKKEIEKQAVKEFAERLKMQFEDSGVFYPTSTIEKKIKATEKQMGVEL